MELNKEKIEAAGFKIDAGGKVRDSGGKLVKQELAALVNNGSVIHGFNAADLRKKKARAAQTGTADLVSKLRDISPAIELLRVGDTAKIAMPKANSEGKDPKRAFVMGVVTKLNNLTALGREWAGRAFDSLSDEEGEYFYVTRLDDVEAKERRRGGGKKAEDSKTNLASALEDAKKHLNGGEAGETIEKTEDADPEIEGNAAIVTAGGQSQVLEDATIITH